MCGICGKLMFDPEAKVPEGLVKAMADAITHRGPDDDGFYLSGQIGLGFRRLSIIDLSGGHQPLSNEDGTIWIIFNGEIYNYQELRQELIAKGHIFRTKSDTEVIVHSYEEYGTECVQKLRGMFGFAIWHGVQKALFLARDRVGIKPLYYYVGKNFLAFGSEMKSILTDPAVEREIDPQMIDRFLTYHYLPGAETPLRNLFKLEPGYTLFAKDGKFEVRRYWDLKFSDPDGGQASRDTKEELLSLLDDTVQSHMISDVPVGFLLSGGVDSTAMLSFAAPKTDKPISTFTIGFSSDSVVDERPYAKLAADRYGAKYYDMTIAAADFASFLPRYVWHMEEPVCQPSAIALYYVSKLASEHVKVVISGEGADEAFAGYETYRNNFWFERLRAGLGPLQAPTGAAMRLAGRLSNSRVLNKYGARMRVPFEEYFQSRASSPFDSFASEKLSLYSDGLAEQVATENAISITRQFLSNAKDFSLFNKMLYVDTKTWLPDELLLKADKMTMANSVELRVPLLDHKVLEFAAGLPRNQKVRGWTRKYLLKKALRGRVPDEILDRHKEGFPIPYGGWLRDSLRKWVDEILLDRKTENRGYFRKGAVEKLIKLNLTGADRSHQLFSLVVLELWHRAFVDREPTASVA